MKHAIYFLICLVGATLLSCSPISQLTVDLTDPPKEGLPEEIQSLTLVNRAVDRRFTDDPADSVQLRFYQKQFNIDTVIYDVKAADTLMQALGNLMFESGRYDIVIPEDRFLMKDSLNIYSDSLRWSEVQKLTQLFNTDAVLSLDYLKTGISTRFGAANNEKFYSAQDAADLHRKVYYAGMRIHYQAQFRIYYPADKENIRSYFMIDTLNWEEYDTNLRSLFRRFTSVKKGLIESGIDAAQNLSQKIAPSWNSYTRAYFSHGDKLLLQTQAMVINNDWDTVRGQWMDNLEKTKSKSLRSKLEFNIALSYEMQGELDEAIRWGVQSYNTMYRPVTYNYLNVLKSRKLLLTKSNENN